ncbi:MAG: aminotransferase class V-fold PLP-dependent enzyme [Gammaproteobacteria bacterium]|nr:aminotransferase class V-fold PLP-dependent enzyme [Gammaproteobacteria bacterium]
MTIDQLLTHEFPQAPDLIYLNHAAVAPWPRRAGEAVKRFAEENVRNGAQHYPEWMQTERAARRLCAELVNAASPDDIAFLKNTSEALSVVAHGFPWSTGDNVVISDEEFPSNRVVWESLAPAGVQVRQVALRDKTDPEQALLEATDRRTRLLAISSVQYASGLRIDLAKLGALCRARGIALCVDAIQGLGVFAHDVEAMHIDFLMADAHKWLLAPEGIAVFYCRAEWRERLALHQYGWHMVEAVGDYTRTDWQPARSARRFECGSPNMVGIYALAASVSLLLEIGLPEIERRVLLRAERLFEGIKRHANLGLMTSSVPGRYAGIVTFRHQHRPATEVHAQLQARNVVCAPRGGGIRFSPNFYTTLEQLDRALAWAAE